MEGFPTSLVHFLDCKVLLNEAIVITKCPTGKQEKSFGSQRVSGWREESSLVCITMWTSRKQIELVIQIFLTQACDLRIALGPVVTHQFPVLELVFFSFRDVFLKEAQTSW